jgi:hypothetical protein
MHYPYRMDCQICLRGLERFEQVYRMQFAPQINAANGERFESIEAKLDELRSYLYANRESVMGYAEAYRNGERISTAHVESTLNQLINWSMCKKHQMGWSRAKRAKLLNRRQGL